MYVKKKNIVYIEFGIPMISGICWEVLECMPQGLG
jgi:hypothetical protein